MRLKASDFRCNLRKGTAWGRQLIKPRVSYAEAGKWAAAEGSHPFDLYVGLFRNLECIVNLDAQIANRTFDLRMTEE